MRTLALLLFLCAFARAEDVTLGWESDAPLFALMVGNQAGGPYDRTLYSTVPTLTLL